MNSTDHIVKLLRCSKEVIVDLERNMERVTGKKGIFDKIIEENQQKIDRVFRTLGISESAKAGEIFDALTSKIESDDHELMKGTGQILFSSKNDCNKLGTLISGSAGDPRGLFLKIEKAKEFLLNEPPKNSMKALGYSAITDMVAKEDVFEIYASLRFIEDRDWLNNVFFKQYESLKPSDFEERAIVCRGLDPKWVKAAEKFITKKYHNISHLKELGFIFIIPVELNTSGEFLRNFSLLLHYFHEIEFYSGIFKNFAVEEDSFAANFISSLRGDLPECENVRGDKTRWLVIQRYLAKDNLFDLRLFVPHTNSETIHWEKAEEDLARISAKINPECPFMEFWKNLNWVGGYFMDGKNNPPGTNGFKSEELIGFNLVDVAMSLVKEKELIKYLYHHQEALWNKIFMEYFSFAELEKMMKENWLKGYIEL